ncbi:unnamed protein product [Boreogadus saida]
MYEAIEAFRSKLHLLEGDIQGRKCHFPRLREHLEKNKIEEDPAMKDLVSSLAENLKERFENSPKLSGDILLFLRQTFSVPADGEWTAEAKRLVPSIDEAALQMEVLEMGTSDVHKAQHKDSLAMTFTQPFLWSNRCPVNKPMEEMITASVVMTEHDFGSAPKPGALDAVSDDSSPKRML